MEGIKWTWNFDVYDESDAPTEEGYYRIIDDEGNEMTDYYFNELVTTPNGLSYWRTVGRPIIAWRFLGKDDPNCSEKPNNCTDCECTDDCTECKEAEHGCKDEPQTETEVIRTIIHKMIDNTDLAEDAYPGLRQRLHDAVDEYEPQTIRCPKCGRSDYIREFGKDFSVTAEEAGFKYKCINCNTYIEPQTERSE